MFDPSIAMSVLRSEVEKSLVRKIADCRDIDVEYGDCQVAYIIGDKGSDCLRTFCDRTLNANQFSCDITPFSRRSGVFEVDAAGDKYVAIQHSGVKIDSIYQRIEKIKALATAAVATKQNIILPYMILFGIETSWIVGPHRGANLLQRVASCKITPGEAIGLTFTLANNFWRDRLLLLDVSPRNIVGESGQPLLCDLEWGGEFFSGAFVEYLNEIIRKNSLELLYLTSQRSLSDRTSWETLERIDAHLVAKNYAADRLKTLFGMSALAALQDHASVAVTMHAVKYWYNVALRERISAAVHYTAKGQLDHARSELRAMAQNEVIS